MLSTLVCVFTLDRIGRRKTLYWGSIGQAITLFLAGGLAHVAKGGGSNATQSGNAAVAMVFLFTMIFGATWLTVSPPRLFIQVIATDSESHRYHGYIPPKSSPWR